MSRNTPRWNKLRVSTILSITVLLVSTLFVTRYLSIFEREKTAQTINNDMNELQIRLHVEWQKRVHAINEMAARWVLRGTDWKTRWKKDAETHAAKFSDFRALEWIDSSGIVRWTDSSNTGDFAFDDVPGSPDQIQVDISDSRKLKRMVASESFELGEDEKGIRVIVPVYRQESLIGFMSAVYHLEDLFQNMVPVSEDRFCIQFYEGSDFIAASSTVADCVQSPVSNEDGPFPSLFGDFHARYYPKLSYLKARSSPVPIMVLFFGVAITCAFGMIAFYGNRSRLQFDKARENEKLYRLLAENIRDVIWMMDLDYNYTYMSPSVKDFRGYEAEEVMTQKLTDMMTPASVRKVVDAFNEELSKSDRGETLASTSSTTELEVYHKDGHHVWAEAKSNFIRDENGKVTGVQGVSRDITDRKKAQEALVSKQQLAIRQQRSILDFVTSQAVIHGDYEETVQKLAELSAEWLNVARVAIWLFDEKEKRLICRFVHDPGREKLTIGTGLSRRKFPAYFDLLETSRTIEIEDYMMDPRVAELDPGLMNALEITAMLDAPIRTGGKVVGVVSNEYRGGPRNWEPEESAFAGEIADQVALAIHNLNQRKSEEELREAKNRAEELAKEARSSNEAKTRFLATMSHEIRTPMNAILGFSKLMIREEGNYAENKIKLESIVNNGEHLLSLINEILDMAKIDLNQLEIVCQDFSLTESLEEIDSIFTVLARNKDLQFNIKFETDMPSWVCGDQQKIKQILMNILTNAVKFTSSGSIEMKCEYLPKTENRGVLRIRIEDTGLGIHVHEHEKIFIPFYQVSDMEAYGGTGLGMSISREFSRLMGGDLTVASTLGEGSEFTLTLDLPRSESPIHSARSNTKVIGLKSKDDSRRILIVDDGAEQRIILGHLLRSVGFDVCEASDGIEAIEKAHQWNPDFVWMDMRMPNMDGYEATRRIKKELNVPIVALSASAFQEDHHLMEEAGCDGHITKPFHEKEIFDTLQHYLGIEYVYQNELENDVHMDVDQV
jgi:PAS domain S-box-containing protein